VHISGGSGLSSRQGTTKARDRPGRAGKRNLDYLPAGSTGSDADPEDDATATAASALSWLSQGVENPHQGRKKHGSEAPKWPAKKARLAEQMHGSDASKWAAKQKRTKTLEKGLSRGKPLQRTLSPPKTKSPPMKVSWQKKRKGAGPSASPPGALGFKTIGSPGSKGFHKSPLQMPINGEDRYEREHHGASEVRPRYLVYVSLTGV
jgi:hypothetical protein